MCVLKGIMVHFSFVLCFFPSVFFTLFLILVFLFVPMFYCHFVFVPLLLFLFVALFSVHFCLFSSFPFHLFIGFVFFVFSGFFLPPFLFNFCLTERRMSTMYEGEH